MKPLNGDSIAFFLAHQWPVGVSAHGHCGHGEAHRCCSAALAVRHCRADGRHRHGETQTPLSICFDYVATVLLLASLLAVTILCIPHILQILVQSIDQVLTSVHNDEDINPSISNTGLVEASLSFLDTYHESTHEHTHTHTESSLTKHFNDKFISKVSLCFWLSFYILR